MVGKGVNTDYQHVLLFQQDFQKLFFSQGHQNSGLRGKVLTLSQTSPVFICLQYKSFENIVGKGVISPFPIVFPTQWRTFCYFHQI